MLMDGKSCLIPLLFTFILIVICPVVNTNMLLLFLSVYILLNDISIMYTGNSYNAIGSYLLNYQVSQ